MLFRPFSHFPHPCACPSVAVRVHRPARQCLAKLRFLGGKTASAHDEAAYSHREILRTHNGACDIAATAVTACLSVTDSRLASIPSVQRCARSRTTTAHIPLAAAMDAQSSARHSMAELSSYKASSLQDLLRTASLPTQVRVTKGYQGERWPRVVTTCLCCWLLLLQCRRDSQHRCKRGPLPCRCQRRGLCGQWRNPNRLL